MTRKIKKFFEDNQLEFNYQTPPGSIGDGGQFVSLSMPKRTQAVSILNQDLTVGAQFSAAADFPVKNSKISLFTEHETMELKDGNRLARFVFSNDLSLGGSAALPLTDLLSLKFSADVKTHFFYRHLAAISANRSLQDGLERALKIKLPLLLMKKPKMPDELHEMYYKLNVDLGFSLSLGIKKNFNVEYHLFKELFEDVALKAEVEATLSAAFGFSLFEECRFIVGGLGVRDDWTRIRIERTKERKMTFGAMFNLILRYNLADGLISMLDQFLELEPIKKARGHLTEISKIAGQVSDADIDTIINNLSTEAKDFLMEELGVNDLINSPEVKALAGKAEKLIAVYNGMDQRITDLVDHILTVGNLEEGGSIRSALEKIANLDSSTLDTALDGILSKDFSDAIELLETIADKELEEFVTLQDDAPEWISLAKTTAQKILDYLNNADDELLAAWKAFAEKSGIKKIVGYIDQISSVDKIKNLADKEIKDAIEKLLGKVVSRVNTQDLDKLRNWAAKVKDKIDDINNFDKPLRAKLEKLKGELSVNMSMSIDRATRRTQLLDIEVNPNNKDIKKALQHLATVDIVEFLAALPESKKTEKENENDDPLPFRIRECLFTNTQTSASAFGILISGLLNLNRQENRRRITSEKIAVVNNTSRKASYSGSFMQEITTKDNFTWNGGFALECEASGDGIDITQPYNTARHSFKLIMSRNDQETTLKELAATSQLLNQMGFQMPYYVEDIVPPNAVTRFSLSLVFNKDAVNAFFQNIGIWDEQTMGTENSIFLEAARNWYSEKLADRPLKNSFMAGEANLRVMRDKSTYLDFWGKSFADYRQWYKAGSNRTITIHKRRGRKTVPLDMNPRGNGKSVSDLMLRSKIGPKALRNVTYPCQATPTELWDQMWEFSKGAQKSSPVGWDSPLFLFWIIVARLKLEGEGFRNHISGLATFRYQIDGEWQPPLSFRV